MYNCWVYYSVIDIMKYFVIFKITHKVMIPKTILYGKMLSEKKDKNYVEKNYVHSVILQLNFKQWMEGNRPKC